MTLTRCSSMPSADTLVKAAGSTRRTGPSTAGAAPALDDRARPAGLHRVGRQQLGDHFHAAGSPTSSSAVPAGTVASLACGTCKTTPDTGERTVSGLPARSPDAGWQQRRGGLRLLVHRGLALGLSRLQFAAVRAASASPRVQSGARRKPSRASCSVRCSSSLRLFGATLARSTRRARGAFAPRGLAAGGRLARAALIHHGGHRRQQHGDHVAGATGSPSLRVVRAKRAATGADTV